MGKFEKPLTWILIIGILGYLFMGNCCKTNSECDSENSFNWSEKVQDSEIEVKIIATDSDTDINIDSMITVLLGDSTMEMLTNEADSTDELMITIEDAGGMEDQAEEIEEE